VSATADSSRLRLRLDADLQSVARARQATVEAAARWNTVTPVTDNARLVVSELVTNAVLHAATEIVVEIRRLGAGLRIEVTDRSSRAVVLPPSSPASSRGLLDDLAETDLLDTAWEWTPATGRGLTLVEGLSDAWGVDQGVGPTKVVWAELGTGRTRPDAPLDYLPAPPPGGHPVRLIAVPLRLLGESESQFDDLLRELQVLALTSSCPPHLRRLASLAAEVSHHVEEARQVTRETIRRAMARGDRLVDLSLILRADGLVGLSRLGDLLGQAARAAAAAELLTLPASREVVAFRKWYRDEVVAQLGGRPPNPCPFPVMADTSGPDRGEAPRTPLDGPGHAPDEAGRDERGADGGAQLDSSGETALAALRADLQAVDQREDVCRTVVDHLAAAGATRVAVCLLGGDHETVEWACERGFTDEVRRHWAQFSVSADLPASEVIRTGRPVLTRTLAERDYRYPVFAVTPVVSDPSTLCVPVRTADSDAPVIGCLVISSDRSREYSPHEMAFVTAAARELANALQRQRDAVDAAAGARRDHLLDEVHRLTAQTRDARELAAGLVDLLAGELADWCGVSVRGRDGAPVLVAARHREGDKDGLVWELTRRWPPGTDSPAAICFRTGADRVFQVVHDAALTNAAQDDDHLRLLRRLGLGSGAVIPVCVGQEVVAVLSLANNQGTFVAPSQLALAHRLAQTAAPALARLSDEPAG
jgi:GAF domain-containing protein/anti-sigma regulatory factor (Ser/Thr protein kinase)